MPSALIFHGPGAQDAALQHAHNIGRLVAPPFGDKGLKVSESRKIVMLLQKTPLGMDTGVVVMGPMDRATKEASDALLKSIEQFDGVVQPVLWAEDLGNVSPTIKSRCLDQWCPGLDLETDDELEEWGRDLVTAALSGDFADIPPILTSAKGQMMELIGVMAEAILGESTPQAFQLWGRLRKVAVFWNPRPVEVLSALLPDPEDI